MSQTHQPAPPAARTTPRAAGSWPPQEPRVVILDLGEVLATPSNLHTDLAAPLERDPEALATVYWSHRDAYDRGGSAQQFWSQVLSDLRLPPTPSTIALLTRIDTQAWTTLRPDAHALLSDLARHGVRVAILSNATSEMAVAARRTDWAQHVTDWFFSAELRMAKPDPVIYHHVTDALGLAPQSVVFIDDRPANVESARHAGWNAHVWESGTETRRLLGNLGLLPSSS